MSENEAQQSDWTDTANTVETIQDTMELFLASADVHAVFHEPILHGENMIIPAAELLSVAGFGAGAGGSGKPDEPGGSGGGGGGHVFARPVAVIIASGDRVRIEPVFDLTKIILAGITAFGFMLATLSRMQRRRLR